MVFLFSDLWSLRLSHEVLTSTISALAVGSILTAALDEHCATSCPLRAWPEEREKVRGEKCRSQASKSTNDFLRTLLGTKQRQTTSMITFDYF